MRFSMLCALTLLLCTPVFPQDAQDQDEAVDKIIERIGKIIDESTDRLRGELRDLVRKELAGTPTDKPVKPVKPVKPDKPVKSGSLSEALGLVTADLLKEYVTYLASDELKGRNAGYPGEEKAAEYIAKAFKKAGLKPAAEGGSYFQHFKVGGRETRNVLGLLEGSDEVLKKEIVVIGAHHDHVGSASEGRHWGRLGGSRGGDDIWNGADDNASGTTVVMALARAFGEGKVRTKRSILFMTFSGEESGLIGSRYYASNPIAPIEDHVFMLNMDMVGRNPTRPVQIQGGGSDKTGLVLEATREAARKTGLSANIQEQVRLMGGDSDHSSFRNRDVPYSFFFSGFHSDYHRVTDHADQLAYDNMVKISKTAAHILESVGNADERPQFAGGGGREFRIPDFEPRPRRRLGITVGDMTELDLDEFDLEKDEGGILVDSVSPESVAQKAGLKEGDFILSMGGKKFSRQGALDQLRDWIRDAKAKEPVELVVIRDGKRMKVSVVWEK